MAPVRTVNRDKLLQAPSIHAVMLSVIVAAQPPAVTFNKHIAPILAAHCASCHRPDGVGPFSLINYRDARPRAREIARTTARRLMPPWKPEHGKGDFVGERRLTDDEIRRIQDWASAGALEGDPADRPTPRRWTDEWQLGTPDLIVAMPVPYHLPANGGDDMFRTFVVPIPMTRSRYVRAMEFQPGNPRAVHHANLGIDRTGSARRLDARDGEPGHAGGMMPDASPPGQLLGWTPGQTPRALPDGLAWRLEKGSDLVIQLHMPSTGRAELVQARVGLFFTDEVPTRVPVALRMGRQTIDIAAGDAAYAITDTYVLPVDVDLVAVQPHAHHLGRHMHATAMLPDGSTRWLISIDDWDFTWQDVYRYAAPLALPKGTTISMRFTYDNSAGNRRNPRQPPRRVVWGPRTSDEMGDLWLQVVPRTGADTATLGQDFRRKTHAQDVAAYTKLLQADPANPLTHDVLAGLHLEVGRLEEAVVHFRESLRLNPESAPTHYNLGLALAQGGQREAALAAFRQAARLDPEYAEAHNNAGAMLELLGRFGDALDAYRRTVALRPGDARSHANLGRVLTETARPDEAVAAFGRALDLDPSWPPALAGLAWIRATSQDQRLRRPRDAIAFAERAATMTGNRDASVLDALAAAYASGSRFEEASATARAAIERATAESNLTLAAQIRQRLGLYEQRRAYYRERDD